MGTFLLALIVQIGTFFRKGHKGTPLIEGVVSGGKVL